ncbi:MAG: Flp family type IVb pilin [Rhodospirillales bacterium]|nr:Flp family type IVb pilin [Rhodospirillales bacterium]MCB9979697.1 Flp family type IVb pilin [Rhodospirillales bacterium]
MLNKLYTYLKREDGATAIEYGLIAGLLSLLIVAGLVVAGPELQGIFDNIGTSLADANAGG